jgi:adenylate kinase family enzyme
LSKKFSRIYIIGSVASGKTTLANELSRRLGIIWYELDTVIWERRPGGDVKRPPNQRDEIFSQIILSDKWIIEDVLRPCFEKGLKRADLIILLDTPKRKRGWYAFTRWVKQLFHIEKSNYKPTVHMLKSMYLWSGDFEKNKNDFMKKLDPYKSKVITIKDMNDIDSIFSDVV